MSDLARLLLSHTDESCGVDLYELRNAIQSMGYFLTDAYHVCERLNIFPKWKGR